MSPAGGDAGRAGSSIVRLLIQNTQPGIIALCVHGSLQSTVRYTELAPDRFKDFWR
jgi:hypothetical protein